MSCSSVVKSLGAVSISVVPLLANAEVEIGQQPPEPATIALMIICLVAIFVARKHSGK